MSFTAHLNIPKTYTFNGVDFEIAGMGCPWPVKKDGEPKKLAGRVFYRRIKEWCRMSDADREKFRTGGGCVWIQG